jgi:hypothetical protein
MNDDLRSIQLDAATRYLEGDKHRWILDIKSCLFYARWIGGQK